MGQTVGVIVNAADRRRRAGILGDRNRPQKHVRRARIVLLSADRLPVAEIARQAGVSRPSVWRWQHRWGESGAEVLLREPSRKPGKAPLAPCTVNRIVALTCTEPPSQVTYWTGRAMAKAVGISLRAVQRIWQAHRLQPHRIRTQPGLKLKPGKCGTMTHDYKRRGTTTLFAALNILDGTVVGRCMPKHTHAEFIKFLNAIERAVPAAKAIHAIADNYATHKHPKVIEWLADHPRWVPHFTPTSASWLNAVEGFFSILTRRRIRRGVFESVPDLQDAIRSYIRQHNATSKPFVWTKPAKTILASINRLPVSLV